MDSHKKENQVAQENGVHTENSDPVKKVNGTKELAKPGKFADSSDKVRLRISKFTASF